MEYQYQLMPSLTTEEYELLKADIAERGVQVPIEFDEKGNILDGHHRMQACAELGIKNYPSIIRPGLTEEEKTHHVLSINLARRHLEKEQRRELVGKLRKLGWSTRKIAEVVRVSHPTVLADISSGKNLPVDRITGLDGKSRPAKKTAVVAKNKNEQQRVFEAYAAMPDLKVSNNLVDVKRLERIAREQKSAENRVAEPEIIQTPDLQILFGDFIEVSKGIPDNSVDLIFTDPPYPKEFISVFSGLSSVAARVLKPGGLVISYTGQLFLPEVMNRLAECLEYVWLGNLDLKGPHNEVQARKIHNHSKPLLFYSKGKYAPTTWVSDTWHSEGKDKDFHEWQQSEGAARYFIETLTKPGQVVFDPFLGGGTTAKVATELNRSFIGCDIDAAAVNATIGRVYAGRTV